MKLCMSVYVYGWYMDFIPMYIYSILFSYPEYFVKIFAPQLLNEQQRKAIEICKTVSSNFEIIENYVLSPHLDSTKYCRWFLPRKHFEDFETVYIGDVDFIIVKEDVPIYDGHMDHCKKNGIPYSNMVRPVKNVRKLSGLHFFKTKEYFDKLEDSMEKVLNNPSIVKKHNETVLYELVSKYFDLPQDHYRPSHGYHLGIIRVHQVKSKKKYWQSLKENGKVVVNTDIYDYLSNTCFTKTGRMFKFLKKYINDR